MDITTIKIGDQFTTPDKVDVKVTNIEILNAHLSYPTIWITYNFDGGGPYNGTESVSYQNFMNNVCGDNQ